MHITRSKELTVRMGDYESFKFKAEVSASHHDLGYSDDDLAHLSTSERDEKRAQLVDLVAQVLDAELEADINDAVELGQDRNSFIQRAFARTPLTSAKTKTRTRSR